MHFDNKDTDIDDNRDVIYFYFALIKLLKITKSHTFFTQV